MVTNVDPLQRSVGPARRENLAATRYAAEPERKASDVLVRPDKQSRARMYYAAGENRFSGALGGGFALAVVPIPLARIVEDSPRLADSMRRPPLVHGRARHEDVALARVSEPASRRPDRAR